MVAKLANGFWQLKSFPESRQKNDFLLKVNTIYTATKTVVVDYF